MATLATACIRKAAVCTSQCVRRAAKDFRGFHQGLVPMSGSISRPRMWPLAPFHSPTPKL